MMKNEMFPIWVNGQVNWLTVDDKMNEWLTKWFVNTPMTVKEVK